MAENYNDLELVNNTADNRFEMKVGEHTAFIEYKETPTNIALIHTEVPVELEGKGVGKAIVEKTLNYIEQHNHKLIPLCPFVLAYLRRHPEWKRILSDGVKNV